MCAGRTEKNYIFNRNGKELAQVKRNVIEAHKETEMRLLAIYYGLHCGATQNTHTHTHTHGDTHTDTKHTHTDALLTDGGL